MRVIFAFFHAIIFVVFVYKDEEKNKKKITIIIHKEIDFTMKISIIFGTDVVILSFQACRYAKKEHKIAIANNSTCWTDSDTTIQNQGSVGLT